MTHPETNPFSLDDPDRHAIWEMLVSRDIDAFVKQDWDMVADDFIPDAFFGIDCRKTDNPDDWKLGFASMEAYRDEWLRQANAAASEEYSEDRRAATFRATLLRDIEISGDMALVHKKFDGTIAKADGSQDVLKWQTVYHCRRQNGNWKIVGFNGYLPNPMGTNKP